MASRGLIGTGGVARQFDVSPATVKIWEAAGLLPRADRLMPGDRRVWRAEDIDAAEDAIRGRRSRGEEVGTPTAA